MSAVISHAIFNLRAVCQFDGDRGRKELLETSLQVVGLGLAWRGAAAGCMLHGCMLHVAVWLPLRLRRPARRAGRLRVETKCQAKPAVRARLIFVLARP